MLSTNHQLNIKLGDFCILRNDMKYTPIPLNLMTLRAKLHTMRFLGDNENIVNQVAALEKGDFKNFLELVNKSGNSSYKGLQNIYTIKNVYERGKIDVAKSIRHYGTVCLYELDC